jgi:hypothetical protein
MKFTSTLVALAATTSFSAVVADNCYGNWNWCGWALLNKGTVQTLLISPPDHLLLHRLLRFHSCFLPCSSLHSLNSYTFTVDLLRSGDYAQMMKDKVRQAGLVNPTDAVLSNTLFRCRKDGKGEIDFQQVCTKGCTYGGSSDSSDFCN